MANKKVKKAAGKQAKKPAARVSKRMPPKAKADKKKAAKSKAKSAARPKKAKAPVKARPVKRRKVAKPVKRAPVRATAKPKARPMVRVAARKAPPRKAKAISPISRVPAVTAKARPAPKPKLAAVASPPTLQRERKRLPEAEAFDDVSEDSRLVSSARAGHDELRSELKKHTEASPVLTAGDVDAKWQDAYALGDEAPGGDNMTPDQDRVDDIGKALGIEYADDEELLGGDEIAERDEHRWELDPASKDEDEDL